MLFFLIDVLIIALFVGARHSDPAVGAERQAENVDRPGDAAPSTSEPLQQNGSRATRRQEQAPLGTSRRHGNRSRAVPRALTDTDIPGWTALDDHQLTRLLKQSSA